MFFTKFPHRANFAFASGFDSATGSFSVGGTHCSASVEAFEGDVYRVRFEGKRFGKSRTLVELNPPPIAKGRLALGDSLEMDIANLLCSPKGEAFGVSGSDYIFQFAVPDGAEYYGMGEKLFGRMELSGLRSKFWNTDVWSDFHFTQWLEHPSDPPYLSLPYVIVKHKDAYVGLLLNTPWPTFMETPGNDDTRIFVEWQRTSGVLTLGASGGNPELWVLVGPTLKELTRKLQKLVGVTPLPPLWALGYHQCRWDYGSEKDLRDLDEKFAENKIPCDGLWLDIMYMDGFRLFTLDKENFPNGSQGVSKDLQKHRRKIIPIIDPGVKLDSGYEVYEDGAAKDVFCKNPEGGPFVGLVWPGETVFPDFTLPKGRKWWSDRVKGFANSGFHGCWIDMNDPSTGPVDPSGMLFNNGKEPHAMHRNEYALGMQLATFDGFKHANPTKRPFILSRSGYIGSSKYAAIWTGDNVANYFYLKSSIPTSLNLSLSGIPFNGPDCGGFGGDPSDQLIADWFKAGFLFPMLRNHSIKDSRRREPWEFNGSTAGILRKYIRLRYTLLPYLYNVFIQQEESGDPIMRPLAYEYPGVPLDIEDAFLVGDSILQAPVVDEKERGRKVALPAGSWMDANNGEWTSGNIHARPSHGETPLYLRNGSVIPISPITPTSNHTNLRKVQLLLAVDPGSKGESTYFYHADDGESYGYRKGKRSVLAISLKWTSKELAITVDQTADGYGEIEWAIALMGGPQKVLVNGKPFDSKVGKRALTGRPIVCRVGK